VEHLQIDFFDRDPAVFWRSTDAFAKLAAKWKPDIIHCHSGVPACAAAISNLEFIGQIHSWGVGRPEWMNLMDLRGFRTANRVLCGSLAYQRILIDGGVEPSRIRYLPWGLNLKGIRKSAAPPSPSGRGQGEGLKIRQNPRPSPNPLPKGEGLFRIGFLGRIEPRKGQLELVQAFHRFHRRYPHSRLELIGPAADKKYREEVYTFVSKAGLTDRVKLRGRVSNPYPSVKGWSLFTSLSSDEGQGIAILEAMALGTPVLCRSVAGVEDYLRDGKTGLSVSSSSAAETADRMAWAFSHKEEVARIASRAKKMVEADYNWDSTVEKMNRLYENVIASSGRACSRLG
jgi:glycosyltransferase involved in cell wall biosynthesis